MLAEESLVPDSWQPEEFILQGRFCPRSLVYEAVEEARIRAGASAAIVLAADEGAFLRSLCFQAPKQPGSPTDLVGLLRGSNDLNKRAALRTLCLTSRTPERESFPFPSSADELLAELAQFAEDADHLGIASWLAPPANWVPARIPQPVRDSRISAAVLFLDPTSCVIRDESSLETVDVDQYVIDITQRINATAQADVRRDAAIMSRLDNRLDPADYVTRTVDFPQAAKSLVALAREISGSDIGACYIFDHGLKAMRLVATDLPEDLAKEWHYEEELSLGSSAVVLTCYSARRPVQLPPGLPDSDGRMTCLPIKGGSAAAPEETAIELATPIVGPLASPKARAVGVLTVAKFDRSRAYYGAYDHALLRNVALRLSLISATTNSEAAARTFTRLSSRRIAKHGGASMSSSLFRGEEAASSKPTVGFKGKPLPDDLMATLPTITEGLETLGRVTGSHSATFRAALPSSETERAHGLVLRRVAAHPPHWMDDDNEIQTAEHGGINWRVVLEGRPHYAPVVASAKGYLRRRKETVAQLSVPVFVQGRVVGTVNLESADRNAYDAQVATAHAFAAHVGLAIADARIAIAGVLHDYATEIVSRGHEIGRDCIDLRLVSQRLGREDAAEIHNLANTIEWKAKGLRRFVEPAPFDPDAGCTFPDLVAQQLKKIELRKVAPKRNPKDTWGVHSATATDLIEEALKDIFHNVKRHATTDGERARLELKQGRWGGQPQDLLVIHNRAAECLDPCREANIFRAPLVRPLGNDGNGGGPGIQVPQLGAYLAGTLIRRVGGEVHLSHGPNEQTRTVVSVPATNPREIGDTGWAS